MKITGYVASPRKSGNTDILVDTFLAGASEGGAQTHKYFLADMEINQCRGCFRNCMLKPGVVCPMFEDDMSMLLRELISSDLVLFASPLYCATYSAILAKFFERCLPLLQVEVVGVPGTREGIKPVNNPAAGKKALVALVQDLVYPQVADLAFQVFEKTVSQTYRMQLLEKIHVWDVRDRGDIKKKQDQLAAIFQSGRKLALGQ